MGPDTDTSQSARKENSSWDLVPLDLLPSHEKNIARIHGESAEYTLMRCHGL